MKLLFTQRKLAGFGGTETITLELARGLKAAGHDVAVYCPRPGKLVGILSANGIACHANIEDVHWRPDVIHAHHHLPAMAAFAHYPDTPGIYVCNGIRPWVERPPRHHNIKQYLANSGKMATYLATHHGLAKNRISIIPNFVDTQRFSRARKPISKPLRRAVLFGQNGFSLDEQTSLEQACHAHGISLDKIGGAYGNPNPNPELDLPDYDIAFAIGRCAIEAMASGCATIPIVPALAGELITTTNFEEWANCNFSPRYFTTSEQVSADWLARQLDAYDPEDIRRVTADVRARFSIDRAIDDLQSLYRFAMTAPARNTGKRSVARYLESLAREADEQWESVALHEMKERRQERRIEQLERALEKASMRNRTLVDYLATVADLPLDNEAADWKNAIALSGLFDRDWYMAQNPDVGKQDLDPLDHYLAHGARDRLEPAAGFDSERFYATHPKLRDLDITPLEYLVRLAAAFDTAEVPHAELTDDGA